MLMLKQLHQRGKSFSLDRAFIIFGVIYFPVSFLFINRGLVAEIALSAYTFVLALMALMLVIRFLVWLAKAANDHSGNYGDMFALYILRFLIPMLMFKMLFYVAFRLLPTTYATGCWCEVRLYVFDLLSLFNVQNNLNTIIMGSIVLMGVFAVYSVGLAAGKKS